MATSSELKRDIEMVATKLQIEAAALAAIADIESGLTEYAMIDGRAEPLIRFEGHYFDRRLTGAAQIQARQQGLAAPQAGAIRNPASQQARWRLLTSAAHINRKAAYESTSWGMGQVMGAHWAWLGYASIDALVEEARSGARGQLQLMASYIDKAGLTDALRRHDWAAFARLYNGPAFAKNNYDGKLARAYARHASSNIDSGGSTKTPSASLLKRGSRGDAVRALQIALLAAGHAIAIDGIFGPATERSVRAFQARHHLMVDGIAGPLTMTALGSTKKYNFISWLWSFFVRLFDRRMA